MNPKIVLVVVIIFVCATLAVSFNADSKNELRSSVPLGGSPTPTPALGLSGNIAYDNGIGPPLPRAISGVTITCQGAQSSVSTSSLPNGDYWLDTSGIGPGPYTVTLSKTGGVNGINSFDAARVAQMVVGGNPWPIPNNQWIAANVSGVVPISSFDSAFIAKYSVGLSGTGLTGTWTFVPASRIYESINTHISGQDYSAVFRGEVTGDWVDTQP